MKAYFHIDKDNWRTHLSPYTKLLLRWGWYVALLMILTTYVSSIIPDVLSANAYQAELQIQVELLGSNGINGLSDATKFFADIFVNPDTLNLALPKLNKLQNFSSLQVADLEALVTATAVKHTDVILLDAQADTAQDATILVTDVYEAFMKKLHSERSKVVNGLNAALNLDLSQAEADVTNSTSVLQSLRATGKTASSDYSLLSTLHAQQQRRVDNINAVLLKLQQQGFGENDIIKLIRSSPDITTVPGTEPTQSLRIALSPLIGLIMGLGGVLLASRFSTAVPLRGRKRGELLPHVIAVIPRLPKVRNNCVQALEHTSSCCLNLLRRLRYEASEHGKPLQIIAVTSPRRREGKSTIASNLAMAAAKSGIRVVLVDVNVRRPILHIWYQIPNTVGTLDVTRSLAEDLPVPSPTVSTPIAKLSLLPIGHAKPEKSPSLLEEEIRVDGLRPFITSLSGQADLIIMDCPSLLTDVGTQNLAVFADFVVLVVDAQKSRSTKVAESIELLSKMTVPFATVLNRARQEIID